MTHDPSRKQFFAKLLGLTAALGVLPKLLAKAAPAVAPATTSTTVDSTPVAVRPETRAVARRADAT